MSESQSDVPVQCVVKGPPIILLLCPFCELHKASEAGQWKEEWDEEGQTREEQRTGFTKCRMTQHLQGCNSIPKGFDQSRDSCWEMVQKFLVYKGDDLQESLGRAKKDASQQRGYLETMWPRKDQEKGGTAERDRSRSPRRRVATSKAQELDDSFIDKQDFEEIGRKAVQLFIATRRLANKVDKK